MSLKALALSVAVLVSSAELAGCADEPQRSITADKTKISCSIIDSDPNKVIADTTAAISARCNENRSLTFKCITDPRSVDDSPELLTLTCSHADLAESLKKVDKNAQNIVCDGTMEPDKITTVCAGVTQ